MIDRIFAPVLAFALLIAGTIAIALAMLDVIPTKTADLRVSSATPVVELERVVVIGKRPLPVDKVVMVEGRASAEGV